MPAGPSYNQPGDYAKQSGKFKTDIMQHAMLGESEVEVGPSSGTALVRFGNFLSVENKTAVVYLKVGWTLNTWTFKNG